MAGGSNIGLTINFNDPEADPEERDEEVQKLLSQMREIDAVEALERVPDPSTPEGSKSLGGFLVGMLTAQVNPINFMALLRFLSDRLVGKPIELEVEANGKKLKVTASSREELESAIQAAQKFISS
ncbi:hypothetical protein [Mastigocladopsis repens]|uniref:hypothetical protein n=1 Tax=Mastigocladopsis repens TaxID=221287 RepID=UPI0002D3AAFA|nr:hypothetical protein [Mastigocladopsis repens]